MNYLSKNFNSIKLIKFNKNIVLIKKKKIKKTVNNNTEKVSQIGSHVYRVRYYFYINI